MSKDIPKSIKQKLLNMARERQKSFNELMQYYVMERFLYRLSISKYADDFTLKGGFMFHVWEGAYSRPTMDIDMLGHIKNDTQNLQN